MLILFLKGLILGIAITAPVGPINLLCIRRSINQGQRIGFITGLGAAVADTFFGAVAAFSLTQVSDFLIAHQNPLQLIGAGVFLVMGGLLLRSKMPVDGAPEPKKLSAVNAFTSGLFLTLHNPTTVFAFLVAFAAVNLGENLSLWGSTLATFGVFIGSAAWWLTLSWLSSMLRTRFTKGHIHKLNLSTGVLLLCCSAGLLYSAFK